MVFGVGITRRDVEFTYYFSEFPGISLDVFAMCRRFGLFQELEELRHRQCASVAL